MRRTVLRFVVWELLFSCAAVAQISSSAILGLVRDSSGAVVPGASVTAIQEETNSAFRTSTTADGYFQVPIATGWNVPPGSGGNRIQEGREERNPAPGR